MSRTQKYKTVPASATTETFAVSDLIPSWDDAVLVSIPGVSLPKHLPQTFRLRLIAEAYLLKRS